MDSPIVREKLLRLLNNYSIDSSEYKLALSATNQALLVGKADFEGKLFEEINEKDSPEILNRKISTAVSLIYMIHPENFALALDKAELVLKSPNVSERNVQEMVRMLANQTEKFGKKEILRVLDLYDLYPNKISDHLLTLIYSTEIFKNDEDIKKRFEDRLKALENQN